MGSDPNSVWSFLSAAGFRVRVRPGPVPSVGLRVLWRPPIAPPFAGTGGLPSAGSVISIVVAGFCASFNTLVEFRK